jgi:uncharacterized protein YecT (DUF1311 family)
MKKLLLAGIAVLAMCASAHAHTVRGLSDTMTGDWCYESAEQVYAHGRCPSTSDGDFKVQQNSYNWIEDGCTFHKAKQLARNVYIVYSHCGGEGMTWTEKALFKLVGERLHLTSFNRTRPIPEASAHARTEGPSFSCRRATLADETAICKNEELATLDRRLAESYSSAMDIYKGGFKTYVRVRQREWLRQRHDCGADVKCIEQSYNDRSIDFGDSDIVNADWCHEGGHMSDVDCELVRKLP